MANVQLGTEFAEAHVIAIAPFLSGLTDELPEVTHPSLPNPSESTLSLPIDEIT